MCLLSSVKTELTLYSDTLQRKNSPKDLAKISEDVAANLHKAKQRQNVFLREDVPVLSQDNSRESVIFEKQMLCREDKRQLGRLTRLKDYATIYCCNMEVKCIYIFQLIGEALQ